MRPSILIALSAAMTSAFPIVSVKTSATNHYAVGNYDSPSLQHAENYLFSRSPKDKKGDRGLIHATLHELHCDFLGLDCP